MPHDAGKSPVAPPNHGRIWEFPEAPVQASGWSRYVINFPSYVNLPTFHIHFQNSSNLCRMPMWVHIVHCP